ncbi:hypothetical protein BLNAU_8669 [Blattamonas nauphoetae]|uniref:Uncharacterized protein n=1 Tax=Blattamonas nauphoetae TaxID=2049346 RepID=A0ABQ9XXX3_9EUKA|nr:hypothetical protein BLNAU_8669 [Blattamonas nauphoetae]
MANLMQVVTFNSQPCQESSSRSKTLSRCSPSTPPFSPLRSIGCNRGGSCCSEARTEECLAEEARSSPGFTTTTSLHTRKEWTGEMTTRRHKRTRRAGPGDAEEVAKQRPSTAGGASDL